MTYWHLGGMLSDKEKELRYGGFSVKSRYIIPIKGKPYQVWAYTRKQATFLARRRHRLERGA